MEFLSATSTASAALVAIVGGLLVSKVVGLATERLGLLHRRDDLLSQLRPAEKRRDDLESRLLRWDAEEVIDCNYEHLLPLPEIPNVEMMIRESGVDRATEEIKPFVDAELDRLRQARQVLEPLFHENPPDELLDELVADARVVVPDGSRRAYDEMFRQLHHEYAPPKKNPFGINIDPPSFGLGDVNVMRTLRSTQEQNEHAQLARDVEQARHDVTALRLQLSQAKFALQRVSQPAGVGWGAAVLGYFATVGTLFPLALMALAIDPVPTWLRAMVLGLFATGVGALLWYVIHSVHRLSSEDS